MIITSYGLIIFQLVVWFRIAFITKPRKAADRKYGNDMLGFAYQAIPTRHEVPGKTLSVIYTSENPQNFENHWLGRK